MKRYIPTCLALLLLAPMVCLSKEEKRFAPLRQQILAAKTIFLSGGPPDVLDKAYGELKKWNRFQVVSEPAQAEVVFEFRFGMARAPETARVRVYDSDTGNTSYGSATSPGVWSEFLTITDAKTKEVLYEDGRATSPPTGAVPVIVGAFKHYSMARDMLKDLRKRIEATESARTFEHAIQLEVRAARYFADAAALEDKLVAFWPSSAEFLRKNVMNWREFADQLSQSNSGMTKFLGYATVDDLLSKHGSEDVRKYRDEILSYTCRTVKLNRELREVLQEGRSSLSPDILQALDVETADVAALDADCNSELGISLMKEQAGKPPSN